MSLDRCARPTGRVRDTAGEKIAPRVNVSTSSFEERLARARAFCRKPAASLRTRADRRHLYGT